MNRREFLAAGAIGLAHGAQAAKRPNVLFLLTDDQSYASLSRTGDPRAVTFISNVASTDPDIEVRRQAVYWLSANRSPEANQALENLLRKK